jgi:quercetin 2,3-dioxygenase
VLLAHPEVTCENCLYVGEESVGFTVGFDRAHGMITMRPTSARQHDTRRRHEVWRTFSPLHDGEPAVEGFGALALLDEIRLAPGASLPRQAPHDSEIITWVRAGSLAFEDSTGRHGVVLASEFQCMSFNSNAKHRETNTSTRDAAHLFQVWMHPWHRTPVESSAQKRFSVADRRGTLCVVASPDGRRGSIALADGAVVLSGFLERGQHIIHELAFKRTAWLHVVRGALTVEGGEMTEGDGAAFTDERAVSFTATQECEVLLIDLAPPPPHTDGAS